MITREYNPTLWLIAGILALGTTGCPSGGGAAKVKNPVDETADAVEKDVADKVADASDAARKMAPEAPIPELQFPQDEAFRTSQPAASEPRPFQLPNVASFKLKNGLQVYLIEQHQLPTISVELNFIGGSMADPRGKEGLASVCMSMMTEGTEKLEKLAFTEALADTASQIFSYAGDDDMSVSMRTLKKHLDGTHALFVDTLLTPGMRQPELDRMIPRLIASLEQQKSTPSALGRRVGTPIVFGGKHPRGRVVTEASYKSLTIDDCKKFHKKNIKPRGARLFVVGDMTEAEVRKYFDKQLSQWKGKAPRAVRQPKPRSMKGKLFFVDVPGAAQSSVTFLHFGPKRKARDYMANEMMSAVLGKGFSSRINMNLREDKGYSYGARGGTTYNRDYGLIFMGSSVRSDSTYQTILEMHDEMTAMKKNTRPPTDQELSREKQGAILGLPGQFATARQALRQYRRLVNYGLPLDFYNSYVGNVSKVTAKQVIASAKKHLQPDNAMIIVIGDANAKVIHRVDGKDVPLEKNGAQLTLLAALEDLVASGKLGKGSVVRVDADGKPVAK